MSAKETPDQYRDRHSSRDRDPQRRADAARDILPPLKEDSEPTLRATEPKLSDAAVEVEVLRWLSMSRAKVTLDRRVFCLEGWYLEPGQTYSMAYLVHQLGRAVLEIPLVRSWAHTLREMIRSRDLEETSWAEGADQKIPEVVAW